MSEVQYISEERYEQILSSGEPHELDALVSGALVFDETIAPTEVSIKEQENKTGDEGATPGAESSNNAEVVNNTEDEIPDGVKPKILSKNGQHTISFEVLEYEREQKKAERAARIAAETELNDLKAKFGEKPAAVNQITPEEALYLTDEELEHLGEIDPVAGKMAKQFRQQNTAMQAEIQELRTRLDGPQKQSAQDVAPIDSGDPVQDAIDQIPQLLTWQARDAKAFRMAQTIDSELSDDPDFLKLSLIERFELVVERTNAALGRAHKPTRQINTQPKIDIEEKIAALENSDRPTSLSGISSVSPSSEKTISQQITGMNQFEMLNAVGQLSDADLDRMLRGEI